MLDEEIKNRIVTAQRNEITECFIYKRLSKSMKDPSIESTLRGISGDELRHYDFWKKYTGRNVGPNRLKIWWYVVISRILGITFGIKLMEKGEKGAQITYEDISRSIPEAKAIVNDENAHEKEIISLIDEERLRYVGSMILGLNDALVELTGALAGFTFTFRNTHLIAATGLITGIAASVSMSASEYLSTRSEESARKPLKASFYVGSTYILTVLTLILPYLILANPYLCLGLSMVFAIVIILAFTFYISVAKDLPFRRRFLEMASISLGVAALTFAIGFLVRTIFNIEIS